MTPLALAAWAIASSGLLGHAVLVLAHAALQQTSDLGTATTTAVTIAAGLAGAALVARDPTLAVVGLPLVILGLAAATVDAAERRLPDALTGPLLLHTTGLVLGVALAECADSALLRSAIAGAVLTGLALVANGTQTATMGWGDIKLMPSLGAVLGWAGWDALATAAVLWALFIALTAILSSMTERDRNSVVPYGPALLAGALGGLAVVA